MIAILSLVLAITGAQTPVLPAPAAVLDAQDPKSVPQVEAPVVVASKPFGESYLLAEMFSQLLESRGIAVDRRLGLGATEIAFRALTEGAIDVYPEYTGTGLVAILGELPGSDAREVFRTVARAFRERYGARWLAPLGFENTYAIAVRRATADSLELQTLSDLARSSSSLVAGLTPDFTGRADGLAGLSAAYGLEFREVRSLLQAVKYRALSEGAVDVIDGYSTDGFIERYDLVVLRDDRGFFPAYEAAPLVGGRLAETRPEVVLILGELSGRLDVEMMRGLNREVEVEGQEIADVAERALADLGLSAPSEAGGRTGATADRRSLVAYLWARKITILRLTGRHLQLVLGALLLSILVAVPLGLALERLATGAEGVIRTVGLLQVVPSIALLAFMIPVFGIGVLPALVALFLYGLYPIVRNTYSGVIGASPEAVGAAEALGMTPAQILRYVRLPLAAPVIMAGVRTSAVIGVGTATLAAFIGAGGLGDPIVAGLALSDTRMILSGAIPAALLALAVDGLLALAGRQVRPKL